MNDLDRQIDQFIEDRDDRLTRPTWTMLDMAIITVSFLFLTLLGSALTLIFSVENLSMLQQGELPEPSLRFSLFLIANNIVSFGLPVIGLAYLKRPSRVWEFLDFRALGLPQVVRTLLFGIGGMLLVGWVGDLVVRWLDLDFDNPQIEQIAPNGFTWFGFLSMLILVGIMVPVAEELFFRGVLFRWLRQIWPFWAAALFSSILFGVLHFNLVISAATAVLGLLAAVVYERYRSIWAPIIIHASNNLFSVAALYICLAQEFGAC